MAETNNTNTNTTVTDTAQKAAENSGGDPKQAVSSGSDNAVSTPDTAQAEKTFTQKELDEIVRQRLEREKKNMPSKDEMKAFRAWQDSQKTEEQKAADALAEVTKAKETAEAERRALEIKVACLSGGVSEEAAGDTAALVKIAMSDDPNLTAEKGVAKVLEKYPVFKKTANITTGIKTQNVQGAASGGTDDFMSVIRANQVKR